MAIEEDLKEFILYRYGSVRAFCMKYEIPYSTVVNIFKRGIGGLGLQTAQKICDCLGIDVDGLSRGIICRRGDTSASLPVTEDEIKFLASYRSGKPEQRKRAKDVLPEPSISDWSPEYTAIDCPFSVEEVDLIYAYRKSGIKDRNTARLALGLHLLSEKNISPSQKKQTG